MQPKRQKQHEIVLAGYQFMVREAFNPNNLCGSYYRTLDPAYLDKKD